MIISTDEEKASDTIKNAFILAELEDSYTQMLKVTTKLCLFFFSVLHIGLSLTSF